MAGMAIAANLGGQVCHFWIACMNTQGNRMKGLTTGLLLCFLTVTPADAATDGGGGESTCSFVNGSVRFTFVSKATESATLTGRDTMSITCTAGVTATVTGSRLGQTVNSKGTSYELVGATGASDVGYTIDINNVLVPNTGATVTLASGTFQLSEGILSLPILVVIPGDEIYNSLLDTYTNTVVVEVFVSSLEGEGK